MKNKLLAIIFTLFTVGIVSSNIRFKVSDEIIHRQSVQIKTYEKDTTNNKLIIFANLYK